MNDARDVDLLGKVYGWFYLSINLGAFASTLVTPLLLHHYGSHVAFGVPGVFMAIATLVFYAGRTKFIHVPPRGRAFLRELTSPETRTAIGRLIPLFLCVAAFWCLFDQTASAWVLQAQAMDRTWLGITWLSSQIQAANPAFILILVPLFSYVVYPAIDRVWTLTPLRKIGVGMFLAVGAFSLSALIQAQIDAGVSPSIGWQVLAYLILTSAEVMVSITCLEFSYRQSPPGVRSIVMAFFLLSVSLGNEFTAVVNALIRTSDGTSLLPGASYFWFFTGFMFLASLTYVVVARWYGLQSSDATLRDAATSALVMPKGIPYIVGNEAAERFSFYGMKAILAVFMSQSLLDVSGGPDPMSEEDAKFWVHTFVMAAYAFPLIGAILSDWLFGKYRTIMIFSVIYCLGHLTLAIDSTRVGLLVGLSLIAIGTGALKPCVSAHVGDQFDSGLTKQ